MTVAPPAHPDVEALMAVIRAAGRPPYETLSPVEARRLYAAGRAALQPPPQPVAEARDLMAETVPLRLYRGDGTAAAAVLPCLLYLHGGGWVFGDLDTHDGVCRRLANDARCCVIAVDYRLAPEHPFPAAIDDAATALRWVAQHAATLRIDATRIAVGGDSAGGNLAAVLALMGRDGLLPRSVFQALLYPATDLGMATDSYARITEGLPLTAATMRWFVDFYAPDAASRADWRASPLRAPSLRGLPPALVLSCGLDPLCDDARLYARRLADDGVRVTALHLGDQLHGLLTMSRFIGIADGVMGFIAAALSDAWQSTAPAIP
ncbi:MAG TPA: alpha/beta hydrolase [Roseomonas sp.]|jgi:acetyl esterase